MPFDFKKSPGFPGTGRAGGGLTASQVRRMLVQNARTVWNNVATPTPNPVPPPLIVPLLIRGGLGVGLWAIKEGVFPKSVSDATVYDRDGNIQPWVTDVPSQLSVGSKDRISYPAKEFYDFEFRYQDRPESAWRYITVGGAGLAAPYKDLEISYYDGNSHDESYQDKGWSTLESPDTGNEGKFYFKFTGITTSGGERTINNQLIGTQYFGQKAIVEFVDFIYFGTLPEEPERLPNEEPFSEKNNAFPPPFYRVPDGYIFPGTITYSVKAPSSKPPPFELTKSDKQKLLGGTPQALITSNPSPNPNPAPEPNQAETPDANPSPVPSGRKVTKFLDFRDTSGVADGRSAFDLNNTPWQKTSGTQKTTKFEEQPKPKTRTLYQAGGGTGFETIDTKTPEEKLQEQLEEAVNPNSDTDTNPDGTPKVIQTPPNPKTSDTIPFDPEVLKDEILISLLAGLTPALNDIYSQTTPESQQTNTGKAICNSTGNGGCMNKDILQPLQAGQNNLSNAFNTGLNFYNASLNTQILPIVRSTNNIIKNAETGLKVTSNFVQKAWKATFNDKVIGVMNLVLNVHNGIMLSNNIASTVGDTISAGLNAIGIKDAEDNPIDVNNIVRQKIMGLIQSIIGTANYQKLTGKIVSTNRILSAGQNIISITRSLADSARDIDEQTGENVSKIGNALRDSGTIEHDSYTYMPEDIFPGNKFTRMLEKGTDIADGVYDVTNTVQDISEDLQEMSEARKEFKEAIEKAQNDETKLENNEEEKIVSLPTPTKEDKLESEDP